MDSPKENNAKRQPIPWKIYSAHTLSTWGDNMWWFAGGLYMMKLAPGSLRLTALYGLIIAATVICFGASVGNWIDKTRRLKAARTFLAIQNICVSVCALGISCFLWLYEDQLETTTNSDDSNLAIQNGTSEGMKQWYFWNGTEVERMVLLDDRTSTASELPSLETSKILTIICVITFSSIAKLASSGTVIILQKDWIVVIADNNTDYLAKINSILRTIELTTYMLAPILAGQLFYFIGYTWTGVFIAIWNIFSVVCEYILLHGIYSQYPRLAHKITSPKHTKDTNERNDCEEASKLTNVCNEKQSNENDKLEDKTSTTGCGKMTPEAINACFIGWRTYFDHPVRNAGLGLSLLYMTVLGFDNITYGYAIIQNVPESILGILVAISAVVGVLGSVAYPILRRRLGLERTGLLGMFLLVGTSTLSVVSIVLPGSPFINWVLEEYSPTVYSRYENTHQEPSTVHGVIGEEEAVDSNQKNPSNMAHITMLMTGIILARFGLWIVDLTITQLLQERVEEERRGIVNGVQDSLNNSMDLLKCVLVILLPGSRDFGVLIIFSYISISCGWLLYAAFSRQQRGHLFHFSRLIPCNNQEEMPTNSHWPFLPEPENKQPTFDCDEIEILQTSGNLPSKNGSELMMKNNSPIIKQLRDSQRLEEIIDCTI